MAHGKGGSKMGPYFVTEITKTSLFQNFDFVFTNFYENEAEKLDRDRES